jgi:hypothetical protein
MWNDVYFNYFKFLEERISKFRKELQIISIRWRKGVFFELPGNFKGVEFFHFFL